VTRTLLTLFYRQMTDSESPSNRLPPQNRPVAEEMTIAKLINGGYLLPELRNDPDAITAAIARLKEDLRGRSDNGGPRTE
jgi:hypothetical protein